MMRFAPGLGLVGALLLVASDLLGAVVAGQSWGALWGVAAFVFPPLWFWAITGQAGRNPLAWLAFLAFLAGCGCLWLASRPQKP